MANIQVEARGNEGKQVMLLQTTGDGVPPSGALGTNLACLFKEFSYPSLNQNSFYNFYRKCINYVLEENILDRIGTGEWPATSHVMISVEGDGTLTLQAVPELTNLYTFAPDNSVSVAIPTSAYWASRGLTVEFTSIAKRMYEKLLEEVLKLN